MWTIYMGVSVSCTFQWRWTTASFDNAFTLEWLHGPLFAVRMPLTHAHTLQRVFTLPAATSRNVWLWHRDKPRARGQPVWWKQSAMKVQGYSRPLWLNILGYSKSRAYEFCIQDSCIFNSDQNLQCFLYSFCAHTAFIPVSMSTSVALPFNCWGSQIPVEDRSLWFQNFFSLSKKMDD